MPFESLKRLLANPAQISAAQIDQRVALKRIELQIDLQPATIFRELRDEIRLARNPKAVGVDHDMADRAGAHGIQDREEVRMQRWLTAGNLHQIGLALACDQG